MKKYILFIMVISLVFTGCGKSPEQLFNSGMEKTKSGNYEEAIQIFQTIIENNDGDPISVKSRYSIARIYLDHLNDYPAGYNELEKVTAASDDNELKKIAGNELTNFPRWLMNKAEVSRENSNMKNAVTILNYLAGSFSSNELAPKAQYLIGDIYNNDLRDFDQAILSYRQVISKFSGSSQEPHAQFMVAYIYANYLNKVENARKEYQVFLDNYPGHELTPSVKFEMEFLGIDINDIPTLQRITS